MGNLGFGTCGDQCPWRGGANENTVFTTSHDIKVQGQPLPAGSYGLHFLPGRDEWTIIFSKNYTSWGSFFYDAKEDALRAKAKPPKSDYHEDLTYWFPAPRLVRPPFPPRPGRRAAHLLEELPLLGALLPRRKGGRLAGQGEARQERLPRGPDLLVPGPPARQGDRGAELGGPGAAVRHHRRQ